MWHKAMDRWNNRRFNTIFFKKLYDMNVNSIVYCIFHYSIHCYLEYKAKPSLEYAL